MTGEHRTEERNEEKKNTEHSKMYPSQLPVLRECRPHIVFDEFVSSSGKRLQYYVTRGGLFTVAHLLFPSADEPSLREFVSFCRRKFLIYKISLFEESSWLGSPRKSSTQWIDTSNVVVEKGIKYNIRKAEKEGVSVRKLDDHEWWMTLNDIHNELLSSEGKPVDIKKRKEMYEVLESHNNESTLSYGAFHQGLMIAGIVVSFTKDVGLLTTLATRQDAYSLAPNPLLITKMCELERERFRWFDMNVGVDAEEKQDEKIKRIIAFKRRFGVEKNIFTYTPRWFFLAQKVARFVKRKK